MGHRSRIFVSTRAAGSFVELSVGDDGPGVLPELLPRVFEALFTTKNFAVGLGLPTARQILERHGGTIDVDSKAGEGATFTIRLQLILASE